MFDTHCHLNFKAFEGRVEEIIENANELGVRSIVIPGTDIESSKKAVQISEQFEGVYAAVGIHPHHVFQHQNKALRHPEFISGSGSKNQMVKLIQHDILEIEKLLIRKKVVAIGEVGLDRHYYDKTKYPDYKIDEEFIKLQKEYLRKQIEFAAKYKKSIIFHNREAKKDFLEIITDYRSFLFKNHCVFHCCEADPELLEFAKNHQVFIGIDGDITYRQDKQEFIKTVPLEMLVLETDSPFLLPVQLREDRRKRPPNEPKNLKLVASFVAEKLGLKVDYIEKITEENSRKLFQII